jgi:hypothetical protein
VFRFRLAPTSTPYGPSGGSGGSHASLKVIGALAVALLGVGVMAGWMLGRRQDKTGENFRDTGTIIVQMQKLGQLHTASFKESDVLTQETETEPDSWVKAIPGGESVVHWATHNQALVTANGTVEAGVDMTLINAKNLEQVRQPDGTTHLRVHLPPVTIYPPNVTVHVEHSQSGPMWHDQNIVPKAQATASHLFREAAEKADIRGKARANALETLERTFKTLGVKNIEFVF